MLWADSTAHRLKVNNNNGGATTLATFTDNLSVFASGGNIAPANVSSSGTIGFSTGKGQHVVTQASNNDLAGTMSVTSSTTGSITFTTNYTSTPVCVLTPQTTGLTSWYLSAISNSGFTVTVAPSGTYTFGYICVGNPN